MRSPSCDGVDTWGSYSLTLIDSLDTLAVMGNFSEFRRVVDILVEKSNFDSDINVSVFETNIRIVGGLISAHLLQHRSGAKLEPGWPCNGPLLRLAEDVVCYPFAALPIILFYDESLFRESGCSLHSTRAPACRTEQSTCATACQRMRRRKATDILRSPVQISPSVCLV